jgi:hypothetical protein
VDDALEANHREQTAAHSSARDEAQDDYPKQASSTAASCLLQELPVVCGGSHVCRELGKKKGGVARVAASRSFRRAMVHEHTLRLHVLALLKADTHAHPRTIPATPSLSRSGSVASCMVNYHCVEVANACLESEAPSLIGLWVEHTTRRCSQHDHCTPNSPSPSTVRTAAVYVTGSPMGISSHAPFPKSPSISHGKRSIMNVSSSTKLQWPHIRCAQLTQETSTAPHGLLHEHCHSQLCDHHSTEWKTYAIAVRNERRLPSLGSSGRKRWVIQRVPLVAVCLCKTL